MSWQIQIPFSERSDSLSHVVEAARVLPTDDAAVVAQIVLGEITGGQATTAGELIDKLEAASPQERRKMLDAARAAAGLKTASEIEFEQSHARLRQSATSRAAYAPPPRLAYSESDAIVDLAEVELERQRAEHQEEKIRRRREEREAEQAVEAEQARQHDEARREVFLRELPPGIGA